MTYDHKITELKFHMKNLISKDVCNQLISFFEENAHMSTKENSLKYLKDSNQNEMMTDNCSFLNLSKLLNLDGFKERYDTIIKYMKIVLVNHEIYIRNNLCPSYKNNFMTYTDNIRIIKYGVGQSIKDHSDLEQLTRGSLTINLNDDYKGGEFRFFGGRLKVNLSAGEAMLFPAEPIWIHGTEPVTKGTRYCINCFLK